MKWETTTSWNIGFDFGFLKDRITGGFDYYTRQTKDLIATVPAAAGTTFDRNITTNVGNVDSQGIEFSVNATPIQTEDWNWDVSFNMTWQKMKVKNLSLSAGTVATNTSVGPYIDSYQVQTLSEGYAPYMFYVYHQLYDEKTGKGLVRHIVTKVGIKTGEIMCVIVINGHKIPNENELVENLKTRYPEIKAIVKNINMKNTNVILGQENINLYGNGYIEDILGEYKFKISPLSFYQVNPVQAEKLYNLGVSMAEITKNDVVFDLYCGIGTISLFMSKFAKKVYGIEIVEEAVKMAKENAQNNNVSNTEFFAGDVEIVLDDLINNKGLKADVVMFDPPRKGLDKKSIDNILNIRPKKIVYISCNPATLIRDLADFENEYDIKTIIPVDMFPFTSHVECVATLQLK